MIQLVEVCISLGPGWKLAAAEVEVNFGLTASGQQGAAGYSLKCCYCKVDREKKEKILCKHLVYKKA